MKYILTILLLLSIPSHAEDDKSLLEKWFEPQEEKEQIEEPQQDEELEILEDDEALEKYKKLKEYYKFQQQVE